MKYEQGTKKDLRDNLRGPEKVLHVIYTKNNNSGKDAGLSLAEQC